MPRRNCIECGIKDGVRSKLGELCKECQQYCPACWEQKLNIRQAGSTRYYECPQCGYQKVRQF